MKKLLSLILLLGFTIKAQEIKIGTQTWTTKNLDVSKFRNGEAIPLAKTNAEWETAGRNKQPAWCYYENKAENGTKYGKLYNWFAVNDPRGLAPKGYHIPTDEEWRTLRWLAHHKARELEEAYNQKYPTYKEEKRISDSLNFIIDSNLIFTKSVYLIQDTEMKSTRGWNSFDGTKPCNVCNDWTYEYREGRGACKACANWTEDYRGGNTCKLCKDTKIVNAAKHKCLSCKNTTILLDKISCNGTNTYGFSALPGGLRAPRSGYFKFIGTNGYWWSSSEEKYGKDPDKYAELIHLKNHSEEEGFSWNDKPTGLSVRCIKD